MVEVGFGTLLGITVTLFTAILTAIAGFLYRISNTLNEIESGIQISNENLGSKLENIEDNTRESAMLLNRITERTRNSNDENDMDNLDILGDQEKKKWKNDDIGKMVIDADGTPIGAISDIQSEGHLAFVEPNRLSTTILKEQFGWENEKLETGIPIRHKYVESVTDDEIRLNRQIHPRS